MLAEKLWPPELVLQLAVRLYASWLLGLVVIGGLGATNWVGKPELEFLAVIISTLSFHGVALVLTFFLLRRQAISWHQAFGFLTPRLGRALFLAVLVTCAVLPVAWTLGQLSTKLMQLIHLKPAVQAPVQMLETSASQMMKCLIGLLAIVVAPVVEEIVFRGLIYPSLKQNGFPRLALLGTSVLFAAIHANLMIFLPLTFLAVILTLLYESTENLLAPICAHSLFNCVNFLSVIYQPGAHSTAVP